MLSASEPTLYYTSPWPGPSPGIPHWSWPLSTLDIAYYFNDVTLNIGRHKSCPISTTPLRVSGECWSRVEIRGSRVGRGHWVTFGGCGGVGTAFGGGIRQGIGVEGACGSVGDCWKGLGIGSTLKHLWNWEVVKVQRMLKVSEVRVGKTLRHFWNGKEVIPWKSLSMIFFNMSDSTASSVSSVSLIISKSPSSPSTCKTNIAFHSSCVGVPISNKWLMIPLLWTGIPEANDRVAKSNGSDVRRTWLQLMCCALPKRLCP